MGKKRLLALGSVLAIAAVLAPCAFSADLDITGLYQEVGMLLEGFGKETLPFAQQFGLTMDGTGRAEVGKSFFFSLSAGTVFLPGIAKFRDSDDFNTLKLSGLLGGVTSQPGLFSDLYRTSETLFFDPGLRLTLGLALTNGIEGWLHFGIIPQAIMNAVGGLVPTLPDITLNRMNLGGRLRFVLVKDQPSLPAVSLGVGYTYTQFNAGLDLGTLLDMLDSPLEFAGWRAGLEGDLAIATRMHTAGVELALSKKLLVFVPFLRLGGWYQWASYSANITHGDNLTGPVISLSDPNNLVTPPSPVGTWTPVELKIHDMSFVAAAGLEIALRHFSLILQGAYNTSAPAPSANISFQFRIG
jgi:hypothetical protein